MKDLVVDEATAGQVEPAVASEPEGEWRYAVCPVCGRYGVLLNGKCSPQKPRFKSDNSSYCERVAKKKAE